MAKDFEQNGHKNIELLRFYVSKDINRIEKKIQKNESDLLGYFVGSLVDLFIVVMVILHWTIRRCSIKHIYEG